MSYENTRTRRQTVFEQNQDRFEGVVMKRAVILISLILGFVWSAFADATRAPLPRPQQIQYGKGQLELRSLVIRFASTPGAEDRFAARELSAFLSARLGKTLPVVLTDTVGKGILLHRMGAVDPLPAQNERPAPSKHKRIWGRFPQVRAGVAIRIWA